MRSVLGLVVSLFQLSLLLAALLLAFFAYKCWRISQRAGAAAFGRLRRLVRRRDFFLEDPPLFI